MKIYTIMNRFIPCSIVAMVSFYLINGLVVSHQLINAFYSNGFNFWLLKNKKHCVINENIYDFTITDVGLRKNSENVYADEQINENSGFMVLNKEEYRSSFLTWLKDSKICQDENKLKMIEDIIEYYFN